MFGSTPFLARNAFAACAFIIASSALTGCAVVSVATTVGSVAVTGAGLVVDAGVGAVKLTGKAIGAAADAVTPDNP